MQPFEKRNREDPLEIFSEEYNAFIDQATSVDTVPLPASYNGAHTAQWITANVNNTSAQDIAPHGVLGLNGGMLATFDDDANAFRRRPVFTGVSPDDSTVQRIAISNGSHKSGRVKPMIIGGIAPVQIDIKDAAHPRARLITADETKLESDWRGPAHIIHKPSGTGVKWCFVMLGLDEETEILATTSANIAIGGTGNAIPDGGIATITAHLKWMHGSQQVSSGKQILARWVARRREWVILGADCESTP